MRAVMRALLVICVAAAGSCGDDGSGDIPDTGGGIDSAGGPVTVGTCDGLTPAATIETDGIIDFMPAGGDVTINVGDVIRFDPTTNAETQQHNMRSTTATAPFSTPLGQVACLTFNQAGAFPYDCSIHPNMMGTITVN